MIKVILRYKLEKPLQYKNITLGEEPIICVPVTSIDKKSLDEIKKYRNRLKLIEIRFDYIFEKLQNQDVFKLINSLEIPYIFTFRSNLETNRKGDIKKIEDDIRIEWYYKAIDKGASLIDFELSSIKIYDKFKELIDFAHKNNVGVIISYHNFKETPESINLQEIIKEENDYGADVLKFATYVNKMDDILELEKSTYIARKLYNKPIISMGMGELAKITRISLLFYGSDITFAFITENSAPGQLSFEQAETILKNL